MSKFKVSLSPSRGVEVTFDLTAVDESVSQAMTRDACEVLKTVVDAWSAWSDARSTEMEKKLKLMQQEQAEAAVEQWEQMKAARSSARSMLDEL